MIELLLMDYLSEQTQTPCYLSVPENTSGTFYVLEKTGGSCEEGLFGATLAVQSYAPTVLEASQANRRAKMALMDADTLPPIIRCDLNTDYNFPDTTRKRPRYQAVFEVDYYE